MESRQKVLIVGGGIAGLSLAIYLARDARHLFHPPTVIEKSTRYGGVGYIVGLWPHGCRVLDDLGITLGALERFEFHVSDERGRLLESIMMPAGTSLVEREQLLSRLRDTARTVGVVVRFRTAVTWIDPFKGLVTTNSGGLERYDLIVGSDGVGSAVRELAFSFTCMREAERYKSGLSGLGWWVNDPPPPPAASSASPAVQEFWLSDGYLGIYPSPSRACCFIGYNPSILASTLGEDLQPPTKANLATGKGLSPRTVVQAFLGGYRDKISIVGFLLKTLPHAHDAFYSCDYDDIWQSTPWHVGKVILLGDACSSHIPSLALGSSNALIHSKALAQTLVAHYHHSKRGGNDHSRANLIDQALARFEGDQAGLSRVTQLLSRLALASMTARAKGFRALRNVVIRLVGARVLIQGIQVALLYLNRCNGSSSNAWAKRRKRDRWSNVGLVFTPMISIVILALGWFLECVISYLLPPPTTTTNGAFPLSTPGATKLAAVVSGNATPVGNLSKHSR